MNFFIKSSFVYTGIPKVFALDTLPLSFPSLLETITPDVFLETLDTSGHGVSSGLHPTRTPSTGRMIFPSQAQTSIGIILTIHSAAHGARVRTGAASVPKRNAPQDATFRRGTIAGHRDGQLPPAEKSTPEMPQKSRHR